MSVWIKICGIRDVPTALAVAASGADAIGLNFYPPSPRHLPVAAAREIVDQLPDGVTPVGVFVNHSAAEIRETCRSCGITTVQLHGDEPASLIGELEEFHVIRALRTKTDLSGIAREELAGYQQRRAKPWAWLVDARVPHLYGGSGEVVDWDALAASDRSQWPPLILAGGLTPENVGEAARTVRPWGVDVASGVEGTPGVKNLDLVKRFVERIRDAS